MHRRISLAGLLALCMAVTPLVVDLRAQDLRADGRAPPVVASGLGLSPEEATKVALRNAVKQVVVDLVDAESRMRFSAVIAEKVLADGETLVTAHKKIAESIEVGLHEVRISAEVSRRAVADRLAAAGVPLRSSDGDGLFSGVRSDLEAQKAALEAIRKVVGDYPVNVLKVEVAGKPRLISRNDNEATFEYELKFEIDREKYNAFVKRLLPILEKATTQKTSGFTAGRECKSADFLTAESLSEPRRFFADNDQIQKFQWYGAKFLMPRTAAVPPETNYGGKGFDPDSGMVVAVCTSQTGGHDKIGWRLFQLPRSRDYGLGLSAEVRFLDRDRKELARDHFTLVPHPGLVITEKCCKAGVAGQTGKAYPFAVISPYFVAFHGQQWLYAAGLVLPQRVTVPLNDLQQMDSLLFTVGSADLLRPRPAARE